MAEAELTIVTKPHLLVEFYPEPAIDFESLRVAAPPLDSLDAEADFKDLTEEVVHRNCGQMCCEGAVQLRFSALSDNTRFPRTLVSAEICCSAVDCPLDDGGYAGDREPLEPTEPRLVQHQKIDEPKQF